MGHPVCWLIGERPGWLGFVVSHPFHDETVKWMGHPGLWAQGAAKRLEFLLMI
jgi:hypothetical protein